MLVIDFFIRVLKFFIFYNFRKQIACVGAGDGLASISGFIWLNYRQQKPDCAIMELTLNVKEILVYFLFVKSCGVSLLCQFLYLYQPVVFKGL